MPFLIYVLMLIAVLSSVALGLDWVVTPPPPITTQVAAPASSIPMAETAPAVTSVLKPAAKAVPATPNPDDAASAHAPATPGDVKPVAGNRAAAQSAAEQARAQSSGAAAAAHCNVQACGAAYQSFRESDCTYQPYEGPRRLCTK